MKMNLKHKWGLIAVFIIGPLLYHSCCNYKENLEPESVNFRLFENNSDGKIYNSHEFDKNLLGIEFLVNWKLVINSKMNHLGFAAYGLTCDPIQHYHDRVKTISIITLNEYSEELPANSDISHLFRQWSCEPGKKNFIGLNENNCLEDILLLDTTALEGMHQFKITVTMETDTIYNFITPEIILN